MVKQNIDASYLEYCETDRQREIIEAIVKCGSDRKAARFLGIAVRNVMAAKSRVRRAAARMGYAPEHDMTRACPDGFYVKGTSTYYNDEGKATGQWVKTNIDQERQYQLMREFAQSLSKDIKPAKPVALKNKIQLEDLLNLYILTDLHLGMLAWAPETGADWDLKTAKETCRAAFSHLVATSPNSRVGFMLNLGDYMHYDSQNSETPTSRHVLDSDTRQPKMIEAGWDLVLEATSMLLSKHEQVILLMGKGNHDPSSSQWLQVLCKSYFRNEPRVSVIVDPRNYYAYQHGQVLLGFHHGDKKTNMRDFRDFFYEEFREMHGQTVRTYLHSGHLHHYANLASSGRTKVERWPTIASRDAHGANHASDRYMPVITYSKRAEVGRSFFYPEMLA